MLSFCQNWPKQFKHSHTQCLFVVNSNTGIFFGSVHYITLLPDQTGKQFVYIFDWLKTFH